MPIVTIVSDNKLTGTELGGRPRAIDNVPFILTPHHLVELRFQVSAFNLTVGG